MDLTQVSTFCFTASYTVALSLETLSLVRRFGWHRLVLLAFAIAGVFAHGAYLTIQSWETTAPLSSPADWCLVASLALASLYLAASFWWPKWATGLFLLPLVLGLIAAASFASEEPLGVQRSSALWARTHAVLLILGTVTVCIGFLAGLMYLIQSWRLKHKLPPSKTFRLPSLEWLERINARSLGVSALLVGGGFVSGLVLTRLNHANENYSLWTDPVVISLAVMFAWLVVAELFRAVYPAARGGRKVAYLTMAAFVFLVITIASMSMNAGRIHGGKTMAPPAPAIYLANTQNL